MSPLIEVERKRALNSDAYATMLERLHTFGYRVHHEHTEVDDYYSRPDVDFMITVECLRVRRRGGSAEVTYKPSSTSTTTSATGRIAKQETNVLLREANQADTANQLLEMLGMRHLVCVEKRRCEYGHAEESGVTVAVDTVSGAGMFVEVEVLSADSAEGEDVLDRVEQRLDVTDLPVVDLPYRDLVTRSSS